MCINFYMHDKFKFMQNTFEVAQISFNISHLLGVKL